MIILLLFMVSIISPCTFAQQVTIHHAHHHRQHTPEVIVIEIPQAAPQQQPPSPHTEEVRYTRKKKLALIGLATAIVGGATAIVVFLTK
jgi:hypothetical protein